MSFYASKYLTRTYGPEKGAWMLQTDTLSDMDRKMIQSMEKLAMGYQKINDKKVRAIQLDYRPIISDYSANKKETTKPRQSNVEKPMVVCCKAIKMNGEKCSAKVKDGAFCARHSKKK
jgi:hypothetical protein